MIVMCFSVGAGEARSATRPVRDGAASHHGSPLVHLVRMLSEQSTLNLCYLKQ